MPDNENKALDISSHDAISDMKSIACGDMASILAEDSSAVTKSKAQLRMFLVAAAKKELYRIIPLTETLDKLLDVYQEKVLSKIETETNTDALIAQLAVMIDVVTKSLDRSYNFVKQMATDEKLLGSLSVDVGNIVNLTMNSDSPESTVDSYLSTPTARNNVREAIKLITKMIEDNDINGQVIDVETTPNTDE